MLDVGLRGRGADQGVLHRPPASAPSRSTMCTHSAPAVREAPQPRDGIVAVAGDLVEPAVHQPHADAVPQVDGGIDQHGSARKFARMRAPVAAERSG